MKVIGQNNLKMTLQEIVWVKIICTGKGVSEIWGLSTFSFSGAMQGELECRRNSLEYPAQIPNLHELIKSTIINNWDYWFKHCC